MTEPTPEQVERAWNLLGKIVGVLNEADMMLVARALAAERGAGWNEAIDAASLYVESCCIMDFSGPEPTSRTEATKFIAKSLQDRLKRSVKP